MPPKEKVSKAKVSSTAFEMTREYGFSEVTARKLADRLGCSTQPIFRAYENMEELRTELFYMSADDLIGRMVSAKGKSPAYVHLALSYIDFAVSERNLFELIASVDDFGTRTISEFLKDDRGSVIFSKISSGMNGSEARKQELFTMFWMFVHGMASLIAGNRVSFSDKQIRTYITKAYEGFVAQCE